MAGRPALLRPELAFFPTALKAAESAQGSQADGPGIEYVGLCQYGYRGAKARGEEAGISVPIVQELSTAHEGQVGMTVALARPGAGLPVCRSRCGGSSSSAS
jgi:hypothetical protein